MSDYTLAIIGNPNSGKTTLFNDLTGARQRTGNWPGVTVERKEGQFEFDGLRFRLIDLPGTYSLDSDAPSLDEQIARDFIFAHKADLVINIIDASQLERSLYLTAQLLDMRVPMVVVLNMMDVATRMGDHIDVAALQAALGCPVFATVATHNREAAELKALLGRSARHPELPRARVRYEPPLEAAMERLEAALREAGVAPGKHRWLALELLQGHPPPAGLHLPDSVIDRAVRAREAIEAELGEDLDLLVADARYEFARRLAERVVTRQRAEAEKRSDRIDAVVLNRWLGIPIFLLAMYLMFTFTINIGGAFVDFFDQLAGALFVDGLGHLLAGLGVPDWLRVLLADGIGGGVQVVATFVPIIGFLYLFLSFLEDSGYMARAAFVMDRLMRRLGLPGKAFVPLIVGFGCNVPAIMATRTLENPRERILTVLMAPFMSCGARLSVYALFAAAFFPRNGQNMVFLLYLIGIGAAMLTALIMRGSLLKGRPEPFLMELPTYQLPQLRSVLIHTWARLKGFVTDAGKYIVAMVIVVNVLNSLGTDGSFGHENSSRSVLSEIGRELTPALHPLGIRDDNWPATVGLLTGVLAKEVVVGTLDAIYSQVDVDEATLRARAEAPFALWPAVRDAFATIPANLRDALASLGDPLGLGALHPVAQVEEAAAEHGVDVSTFGAMARRFDGQIGAFAYLLFVLLYVPCVAATAAIRKEVGWRWMSFAVVWSIGLAYMTSTAFYQLATWGRHPAVSLAWVGGIAAVMAALVIGLRLLARRLEAHGIDLVGGRPVLVDGAETTHGRSCCH